MKLKKYILFYLLISIILLFTSCSNSKDTSTKETKNTEIASEKKEDSTSDSEKTTEVDNKKENNQTTATNATEAKTKNPLSNINIVIDPGHASKSNLEKEKQSPESNIMKIKDGGGADGVVTKTPEYKICMNVSLILNEKLKSKGFNVIMTKEDNSLSLGNIERAEIGNKNNANLVVRIHADSAESKDVRGASLLIPEPINANTKSIYDQSKQYATTIINTFCEETNAKNRGIYPRDDMTGFNWSKVPVVLIEMGFLSNPEEDKLLNSKDYQEKCAEALSKSIEKCFMQ